MSNLKWKPKNDFIGVPGKGVIPASKFSEEDLKNLTVRAKNRKQDVHTFLLKCGLVPDQAQVELELEVKEEKGVVETSFEDVEKLEPPKKKKDKKDKVK
jgi:hypothetical protein